MTHDHPTEPIRIDTSPTQPIRIDPEPTIPVPSVHPESSGPVAIVPPPYFPPAGAASSPVSDPTSLSLSESPTTVLPSAPPVVAPSASYFGSQVGSGGGIPPIDDARVVELQQRLDASEASRRRRTRVSIAVGALGIIAAVATTLAVDSWYDNRSTNDTAEAAPVPTTAVPRETVPPTTESQERPIPSTIPDDGRKRTDDPTGRNGGASDGGSDSANDRSNEGGQPSPIPSTGNATVDEWIDSSGLNDAWEELQRLEDEYLSGANQWLDDLLGESTNGSPSGNSSRPGSGR